MHQEKDTRISHFIWVVIALLLVVAGAISFLAKRGTAPPAAASFNAGVAALERYQYLDAFNELGKALQGTAGSAETHFNRGLAALNLQDEKYLKIAEEEFQRALSLKPEMLHARFCLGILYLHTGRAEEANRAFSAVVEKDPDDPFALNWQAVSMLESRKDGEDRKVLEAAAGMLEKALGLQPAFGAALYRLSQLYRRIGEAEKSTQCLKLFSELKEKKSEVMVGFKYGESGKYMTAIRELPGAAAAAPGTAAPSSGTVASGKHAVLQALRENIEPVRLPSGKVLGPGLAVGDVNGDGFLDAAICGGAGGPGPQVEIWIGSSGPRLARAGGISCGAALCQLGDLDNDGDLDLTAAGGKELAVFLNDGKGAFTPAGYRMPAALPGDASSLLVLDFDSDWDLDIAVACQVKEGDELRGALLLINNNRDGSFEDKSSTCGLDRLDFPPQDLLFGDLDADIDQDFLAFDGRSGGLHVFLNDRAWRFRHLGPSQTGVAPGSPPGAVRLETGADGKVVLRLGSGKPADPPQSFLADRPGMFRPAPASGSAAAPGTVPERPFDGTLARLPAALGPWGILASSPAGGIQLEEDTRPPAWIGIDLNGPAKPVMGDGGMWSNLSGIGAKIEVRAGSFSRIVQVNGSGAGSAGAPHQVYFELPPGTEIVDYVRIVWPDGILQSETRLPAGHLHAIGELERKPTSCPILFVWNGERFEYIGDFLGVGGLGYLEAPGVYSKPDPTELMEIPGLQPRRVGGREVYELRIVEPLEECTYLDAAQLLAVDHPGDMTVHPREMFAVAGPQPDFGLVACRRAFKPQGAADHRGADVAASLLEIDRVYAENWRRDRRFAGAAESPHAIILDFGGDVEACLEPGTHPVLCLYGYIEYGFSTSNFAASQAGLAFRAPSFSVERAGEWTPLLENWGFPGGTPRWMAVDLAGLLKRGDRRIRIETNLEIYWDQAILAAALDVPALLSSGGLRETALEAASAELSLLGFPRDDFADGRHPRIYHYDDIIPADRVVGVTQKVFPGAYTPRGDVRALLRSADDAAAVFGPGEEIALSFEAARLPALPEGWKRTFFLRAQGWCKDMDLYTANSDRVEPLPYRGMPAYEHLRGETPRASGAAPAAARLQTNADPLFR